MEPNKQEEDFYARAERLLPSVELTEPGIRSFTKAVLEICKEENAQLKQRVDQLVSALEPFCKVNLAFTEGISDSANIMEYEGGNLTLGDFRRANNALKGGKMPTTGATNSPNAPAMRQIIEP